MPPSIQRTLQHLSCALLLAAAAGLAHAQPEAARAQAQDTASRQLAPGFTARPAGSTLVVVPADLELFSISAGGVAEPRADWTEAAQENFAQALAAQGQRLGSGTLKLSPAQLEELHEVAALHRAVARAISIHHRGGLKLPTKDGRLDWSLGQGVRPLKERTGADYALFTWMRDSYASKERKATMVALALLGGISTGGEQEGYASLVDLNTGRVVWFNRVDRMWGDLRSLRGAEETVDALLKDFPELK